MPTYQYKCSNCQQTTDIFQKMSDPHKKKCPLCGKLKLVRMIGIGSGIIFKGSGFYCNDYKVIKN